MKIPLRTLLVSLFVFVGLVTTVSLVIIGWQYYLTPLDLRPFKSDYIIMKPSGFYGHGLGILGTLMVLIGVTIYSTRKRLRSLRSIGKLSRWLEIHIFLCTLGPVLIVCHTTFKVGGIAAIAFWTMLSVFTSGIIGRFLYVLIPRNLNGTQLTMEEITSEMQRLGTLLQGYAVGILLSTIIDKSFATLQPPRTFFQIFSTFIQLERIKIQTRTKIRAILSWSKISPVLAAQLRTTALSRAALLQKSLMLTQIERLFFYWHAIHLPFTIIMFITLAVHVTVVILLGYIWVF